MESTFEFSDNVVGIILEQKVDSENLKQIQKMLEEKIIKYSEIRVYLEDKNSDGITLKAVLKDLAFEISQKKALQKIAVVTDVPFFKMVTEMKQTLVNAEVATFDRKDRMQAMAWVMQ